MLTCHVIKQLMHSGKGLILSQLQLTTQASRRRQLPIPCRAAMRQSREQGAAHLLHPRKHQAEAALGTQALQQVCNVISPFLHGRGPRA